MIFSIVILLKSPWTFYLFLMKKLVLIKYTKGEIVVLARYKNGDITNIK